MNIVWLVLAVLIWGTVHSVTASLEAKAWFRTLLGNSGMKFYRFVYNIFSVISFAPILWLMLALPDHAFYSIPKPWMYLALTGQALAVVLLVAGVLQTDASAFVGLRQLFEEKERSSQLVTRGLYRWVRHPLYAAGLLFIWLTPVVSQNSLIVFIAATCYILVGALFEEHKLAREFGAVYTDYKAVTPMLIPGLIFPRNK